MRLLCTNPCRDVIVPSYVDAHWLKKGKGRPLLDEGYSLSFNSIGVALEAIIFNCHLVKVVSMQFPPLELGSSNLFRLRKC